jgi:hypothetical protein
MGRQEVYQRVGVHAPFDPQHKLVTSAVFSPLVLALIRSTLAIYTLVSIVFSLAWKGVRLAGIRNSDAASCVLALTCAMSTDLLVGTVPSRTSLICHISVSAPTSSLQPFRPGCTLSEAERITHSRGGHVFSNSCICCCFLPSSRSVSPDI